MDSSPKAKAKESLNRLETFQVLAAAVFAGFVCVFLAIVENGSLEKMNAFVYGELAQSRLEKTVPGDIFDLRERVGKNLLLLTIDEESLESRNLSWPIPRGVYADVVDRLDRLGASSIGFDMIFNEPSADMLQDQLLSEAFLNPKVVLTYPVEIARTELSPKYPLKSLTNGWGETDMERRLGFTWDWTNAARRRFIPLRVGQDDGRRFYALSAALLAHHRGIHPAEVLEKITLESFQFTHDDVTLTVAGAPVNIKAFGLPGSTTATSGKHSLSDIVEILTLDDLLSIDEADLTAGYLGPEGFIAVVGVTSRAGFDAKDTLVGEMSGAELHINVLLNLMENDFIRELSPYTLTLSLLVLAAGLGFLGTRMTLRHFYRASVAVLVVFLVVAYAALEGWFGYTLWIPLFIPVVTMATVTIAVGILRNRFDRKRLSQVMDVLKEVCPAADLESVVADGVQLGGVKRELTILFSDLRGYTTFVEERDAVTVLDFLNSYYGCVSDIVHRYGGVVLDYQGDAQMIAFGLTDDSKPNHAAAAVKAGVEMILTLDQMREDNKRTTGMEIPDTGVGICTGNVSFGVLGTAQRKQYVAIGDPTNTAARLQGKSADLGERVLASRSTRVLAGEEVVMEFMGDFDLKGKKKKVGIFSAKVDEMIEQGLAQAAEPSIETGE